MAEPSRRATGNGEAGQARHAESEPVGDREGRARRECDVGAGNRRSPAYSATFSAEEAKGRHRGGLARGSPDERAICSFNLFYSVAGASSPTGPALGVAESSSAT